jgi:hypothetical protein
MFRNQDPTVSSMTFSISTVARTFALAIMVQIGCLPHALANEPPPPGSRPGRSIYVGKGSAFSPNRVRIKVVDQPDRKTIMIWNPPSRHGAFTVIYTGGCFNPGCVFTNNLQYAYPNDRTTLRSYSPKKFVLGDWMYEFD